jgi:hypothetical protein
MDFEDEQPKYRIHSLIADFPRFITAVSAVKRGIMESLSHKKAYKPGADSLPFFRKSTCFSAIWG